MMDQGVSNSQLVINKPLIIEKMFACSEYIVYLIREIMLYMNHDLIKPYKYKSAKPILISRITFVNSNHTFGHCVGKSFDLALIPKWELLASSNMHVGDSTPVLCWSAWYNWIQNPHQRPASVIYSVIATTEDSQKSVLTIGMIKHIRLRLFAVEMLIFYRIFMDNSSS